MISIRTFSEFMDYFDTVDITNQRLSEYYTNKMLNVVQWVEEPENFDNDKFYLLAIHEALGLVSTNQVEFDNFIEGVDTLIYFLGVYKVTGEKKLLYGLKLCSGKELKKMLRKVNPF